tara:strand:+ start:1023 stop:1199 length:177 start_codon:yes stop_codon:yes gene_type:complete
MSKFIIMIVLLLIFTSCASKKKVDNFYKIEFPDSLNFDTFKEKLESYSKTVSYPNLNE